METRPYRTVADAEAALAKAAKGDTKSYWEVVRRYEATPGTCGRSW